LLPERLSGVMRPYKERGEDNLVHNYTRGAQWEQGLCGTSNDPCAPSRESTYRCPLIAPGIMGSYLPLCKPVKLSPDTRVDAYVFGDVTRAYGVKRYYAGYPEDLVFIGRYMYVVKMPIGVADDKRIKMVFVLRAYMGDRVVRFNDCWLVKVSAPFPIYHPLNFKRALIPYRVYNGWVMKLYRRAVNEVVFLASSKEIAEEISWRIMVGKKVRLMAYRYLYPVACYKCPKSLLVYDKPVERSTFYARYPEDSRGRLQGRG